MITAPPSYLCGPGVLPDEPASRVELGRGPPGDLSVTSILLGGLSCFAGGDSGEGSEAISAGFLRARWPRINKEAPIALSQLRGWPEAPSSTELG